MSFDDKSLGIKSARCKTLLKLPKSTTIMAELLEKKNLLEAIETKTRFPSSNANELCDR